MKLINLSSFVAFLAISPFAKFVDAKPEAVAPDTSEYLRVLAGLKMGTLTLPSKNISTVPWVYTSQGQEFGAKLKESKLIQNLNAKHLLVKRTLSVLLNRVL
jgi:hypothetical protein